MSQSNMTMMIYKLSAIALATTLAIGAICCAPSPQQQTSVTPNSAAQTQTNSQQMANAQASSLTRNIQPTQSAVSPKPSGVTASVSPAASSKQQHSAAASVSAGQPSTVNLKSLNNAEGEATSSESANAAASAANEGASASDVDTFDGKNPFSDESLWQIPFQLVRDLTESSSSPEGGHVMVASKSADSAQAAAPATNEASFDGEADEEPIQAAPAAGSPDLKTAADYHHPTGAHHEPSHHSGGHHGADHYGKYFQYAGVPKPGAWEFGYRRGNPYHTIERYEHGKGPHFQTKVKWSDKHAGYGVHVFDYNHGDHHKDYDHHHYEKDEHHAPAHHGAGHHSPAAGHYGHH